MDMSLNKLKETVNDKEAWHAVVHGVTKRRMWLSNWMELTTLGQITWMLKSVVEEDKICLELAEKSVSDEPQPALPNLVSSFQFLGCQSFYRHL